MLQLDQNIIELESIDSTNNYLSKLISTTNVPNGTVILARNQTNGRGQRTNKWDSEAGKNIALSLFLTFNKLEIKDNFYVSMMTANAIHQFIKSYVEDVTIKWPNDLLIDFEKICGILIENTVQGKLVKQSIIGIGMNVNQEQFDSGFKATSLKNINNKTYDILTLSKELLHHLSYQYSLIIRQKYSEIKEYYLTNLIGFNNEFKFKIISTGKVLNGQIIDVESNGLVVIKSNIDILTYGFKEIEFLGGN